MTFMAHSLVGAVSLAAPYYLLRNQIAKKDWRLGDFNWSTGIGATLGSLPDTLDWLLALLGLAQRWEVYMWFHAGPGTLLTGWMPPIFMHLWLDSYIHTRPNYNWWPDFWWLEIACWIVTLPILYYLWREESYD